MLRCLIYDGATLSLSDLGFLADLSWFISTVRQKNKKIHLLIYKFHQNRTKKILFCKVWIFIYLFFNLLIECCIFSLKAQTCKR